MADSAELKFILKMRDEASAILKAHGMAAGEAGAKHQEAARGAKAHADALTELGKKAKEATEAIAALWTANELARKSLEAFNEYEQGMIRVARTTQLAGQSLQDFQQAFDDMARSTKGASVENLLEFSEVAGQLGIRGTANILSFSETLGKLTTVTNIAGEAGAKQFGRLLLLTGEGAGGVKKLADSLTGLQADTKASAAEILRMGSQIAQTTAGFKLGTAEITGMAAAATQLNIEPFLLSNAVGRSLRALKDGMLNVTAGARDLSTMVGMNREAFIKLIDTHPDQALLKFLNVIRALQANGQSVTGFLQKFQLQGDESQKVLLTLAKNVDEVNEKIKESQRLQSQGGSLDNAYKGFAESLQGELSGLQNAWDLFAKDLGKALSPVVKRLLNDFAELLNGADRLFQDFPDLGQKLLAWGAIGIPALFGLNRILNVFGSSLLKLPMQVASLAGSFTFLGNEARAAAAGVGAVEAELAAGGGLAGKAAGAGGGMMGALGKGAGWLAAFGLAYEGGKEVGNLLNEYAPDFADSVARWRDAQWAKIAGPTAEQKKQIAIKATGMSEEDLKGLHDRKPNMGAEAGKSDLGDATPVFEMSDVNKQALEHFDQYTRRVDDLRKAEGALQALREGSAKTTPGLGDAKTEAQIRDIERAIDLERRALDPMNKLRDAWEENLAAARAYTKEQQNQYEIEKAIAQEARTNPRFTKGDADEIRSKMSAIQDAQRTKAFREQAIAMNQQLATAAALTQADKDRLEINQQIAALSKDKGFSGDQLGQLRTLLELTKQVERENSQFKSLNPQANALIDYNNQLQMLNDRLKQGRINQEEFNREKTKLDNDTLEARNPVGKIVQDQQDEIAQLGIIGRYREADLKTLQEITKLKREGVLDDSEQSKQIELQLGANNRMIQDVKDLQEQLDSLTQSFGSGLSQAIGGALNGQKYAFDKFLAGMGQKMMDSAFSKLASMAEGQLSGTNGPLSSLFGQAKAGTNALGKLAQDQADKTLATGQMTVNAMNVIIQGATARIDDLTKQAEQAGAPSPLTSGVPQNLTPMGQGGIGSDAAASRSASPFGDLGAATKLFAPQGLGAAPASGASPTDQLAAAMKAAGGGISLSDHDISSIAKVAYTEVAPQLKKIAPEQYDLQRQGVVDTMLNREKDGGYGKNIDDIANKPWQFTQITRNGGLGNTPEAPDWFKEKIRQDIASRASGARGDVTGGGTMYLNPAFSDAKNLDAWGNSVVAQGRGYGVGNMKQFYGAAPGKAAIGPYGISMPGMAASGAPTGPGGVAIGDSIGKGLGNQMGIPTYATVGYRPDQVLDQIRGMDASQFGKGPLYLSSGISNNATDMKDVMKELQLLKAKGVDPSNINLLGVGDRADYQKLGVNDQLAALAKQQGVNFRGALDPSILGPDHVHPNYAALSKSLTAGGNGGMDDAAALAKKAQEQMAQSQKALADSLKATTQNTENSLTSLTSGITDVGDKAVSAVPDMGSFGSSITGLLSKMASGLGGGLGGAGGGLFAGIFHAGGAINGNAPAWRAVSASTFAGASRFHDGLGDDEFPAILQKGERVLTQNQDTRATTLMAKMADQLANSSTMAGQQTPPTRGNGGNRVTMIVNAKDASSFRYSQAQIMAQAHAGVSRAGSKNN